VLTQQLVHIHKASKEEAKMAVVVVAINASKAQHNDYKGTLIDVVLENTITGTRVQAKGITYIEDEDLDYAMEEWLEHAENNVEGFVLLS
jgi:hypothetical protein